jgi:hypothetical protein
MSADVKVRLRENVFRTFRNAVAFLLYITHFLAYSLVWNRREKKTKYHRQKLIAVSARENEENNQMVGFPTSCELAW